VPIGFGSWQIARHAFAWHHADMFDAKAAEFIAAKAPPETQQDKGPIPQIPQFGRLVGRGTGVAHRAVQPVVHLIQVPEFQRLCALLERGMQRPYAAHDLAHERRLGWIDKAVLSMPMGDGSEPLPQGADGQRVAMAGQIPGDAVRRGGQQAAPFDFEVAQRRLVGVPGVIPGRSMHISIDRDPAGSFPIRFHCHAVPHATEERHLTLIQQAHIG
jgi:hypothetical protein